MHTAAQDRNRWKVHVEALCATLAPGDKYLTMKYLPLFGSVTLMQSPTPNVEDQKTFVGVIYPSHLFSTVEPVSGNRPLPTKQNRDTQRSSPVKGHKLLVVSSCN